MLSVDGHDDVALADACAEAGRLVWEQLLDAHHAARLLPQGVHVTHDEAEAKALGALGQGHLECVVWGGSRWGGGTVMVRVGLKVQ